MEQNFYIGEPGQVLGAYITYIGTDEGWLYLAGLIDFYTKEIVGNSMGSRMTKDLTIEALESALKHHRVLLGALHQYYSPEATDGRGFNIENRLY